MSRIAGVAVAALITITSSLGIASVAGGESPTRHAMVGTPEAPGSTLTSPVLVGKAMQLQRLADAQHEIDAQRLRDAQALQLAQAQARAQQRRTQPVSQAVSTPRSVSSNSHDDSIYSDAAFYRVAQCETGGQWNHQTAFDGGLGILHANWIADGGRQFAEYGSQATPAQQILIAREHVRRYGIHGWGCWRAFLG